MRKKTVVSKVKTSCALTLLTGAAFMLSGCIGDEDSLDFQANNQDVDVINEPAQIAQVSADDYDNNVNGLITGATLAKWIENWPANRPAGVSGKLVILQHAPDTSNEGVNAYIKPDGENVFTYHATEWTETRSNGVIETGTMVPSGRAMDTFLAKYDIDPSRDMIVCAQGAAGAGSAMRAGRCWYMFRYWGTSKNNLAQLNGGNSWLAENTSLEFSASGSTPPFTGSASVKDLVENNFSLKASVGDMMDVVPSQDANFLGDGVFIWDARGENEYNGTQFNGPTATIQGHPNGALLLPYANLFIGGTGCASEGCRFKSKAEIEDYMAGDTDTGDIGFVDGTLQAVGYGRAYQQGDVIYTYCQTTMRAMITGFASAAILGLPTRFYDGAMVEWNSLSSIPDSSGTGALPWDSKWRTDKLDISNFLQNPNSDNAVPPAIVNPYATSSDAIYREDMTYKGFSVDGSSGSSNTDSGENNNTSDGGGVTPPSNPCG